MFITIDARNVTRGQGVKDPINIVTIIESNIHWIKDIV